MSRRCVTGALRAFDAFLGGLPSGVQISTQFDPPASCAAACTTVGIITSAGSYLPYVFLGSLVFESFFGIPGLGAYVIEAIGKQDFAIVRTMVFLGSLLYIATFVLIDVAYTWADPRVRLG